MKNICKNDIDAYWLHIFAFVTMFIDHLGYYIFHSYPAFRIIGRLAFPIFAFFIAEGIKKTKNIKKYVLRILVSCFISEIPFNLFVSGKFFNFQNNSVMWTYLIAILGILVIEKYKEIDQSQISNTVLFSIITAICFVLGNVLNVDYNGYGCLLVFIFYFIDIEDKYGKFLQLTLFALIINIGFSNFTCNLFGFTMPIEFFSLLSFPILWVYNGKQGKRNKYTKMLFYSFYPVHLLILGLYEYFVLGW